MDNGHGHIVVQDCMISQKEGCTGLSKNVHGKMSMAVSRDGIESSLTRHTVVTFFQRLDEPTEIVGD
jgi:hypothetical protein